MLICVCILLKNVYSYYLQSEKEQNFLHIEMPNLELDLKALTQSEADLLCRRFFMNNCL